jgi:hypothetical protein
LVFSEAFEDNMEVSFMFFWCVQVDEDVIQVKGGGTLLVPYSPLSG